MKIIFEGVGESADRFIYAEYCTHNHVTIRIEDLKEPDKGQELTLTGEELESFVTRLRALITQMV